MNTLLTQKSQIKSIGKNDILINQSENQEFEVINIDNEIVKMGHSGTLNYLRIIDTEHLLSGEWLIKEKVS